MERCCKPRCRQPVALRYYGVLFCQLHWESMCAEQDRLAEADYAEKLRLRRIARIVRTAAIRRVIRRCRRG